MKRKFKPYLDIKDNKHLQLLLNRQLSIDENTFPDVEVDDLTEEAFRKLAEKFKNFYGYEPAKECEGYINEIIYFLLANRYLISVIDKISAHIDKVQNNGSFSFTSQQSPKLAFEDDVNKPHIEVQMVGDVIASIEDKNSILSKDQLEKYKKSFEENIKSQVISLSEYVMKGDWFEKVLRFLGKNIDDIDIFIATYFGEGFYSLENACRDAFEGVDFNDISNAKLVIDKLKMILSKAQTVLFLLGTNVKQLRFHMIISILTSRRIEISVKDLSNKADDIYNLFKKLKNTMKLH